jgi:hypothetical protein
LIESAKRAEDFLARGLPDFRKITGTSRYNHRKFTDRREVPAVDSPLEPEDTGISPAKDAFHLLI